MNKAAGSSQQEHPTSPAAKSTPESAGAPLSTADRRFLLHIARSTLDAVLAGRVRPHWETDSPSLLQRRAVFVTLREAASHDLRGCRGETAAHHALVDAVARMAIASAIDDPRFRPVTHDELSRLSIEISALTPMTPIEPDAIEVGTHGLMLIRGRHGGLLLPQVPLEYGWDRGTFLEFLCQKAGLPPGAWAAADAELFGFEAEVWGEDEIASEFN